MPSVEASPSHPEFLGQLVDARAGRHAFYGHALNFREYRFLFLSTRVSLPESVPIASVPIQGVTPVQPMGIESGNRYQSENDIWSA